MGEFLGYLYERILIFFRKRESPTEVMRHGTFSKRVMTRVLQSIYIKMIETLKYSIFQVQFVIKIFTICRAFLVHILASECAILQ